MLTFKKFLEADGTIGAQTPDATDLGTSGAPTQPNQSQQAPQGKQLKGTLTDNAKRVLALLSANELKSSPGLARTILSGDPNLVAAVKQLKLNFKAVDVTPDGVTINQTGVALAGKQGVVDPNSGQLTQYGTKLATTLPNGNPNPKTKDVIAGAAQPQGGQQGGMGDPMGGLPPA